MSIGPHVTPPVSQTHGLPQVKKQTNKKKKTLSTIQACILYKPHSKLPESQAK